MDSPAIAADLASDQEFAVEGHDPQISLADQKQKTPRQLITAPSVSVLCSSCASCAQKRVESEWNFNIEDGVPVNKRNTTSSESERGDSKKDSDRADKSQKMRRNMGRVLYRRSLPVLPSP